MISFIVPIYNAESTIRRCIISILSQDYSDIQVIAINDGSSDNSLMILKEIALTDSRLLIIDQPNSGVSIARNRGLEQASGEYVMFVDSDDYLDYHTCSNLKKYFLKDIDLIIFGLNIYKNNVLLRTPHLNTKYLNFRESINYYWYLRTINLGPCNKVYKRKLITKKFDETLSLGEDTLFVLEYMKNISRIQIVSSCFYNVTLDNTESLNRKYREDRLEQLLKVRNQEILFLRSVYPNSQDLRIFEEYFRNLHIILTDLVRTNIANKYSLFVNNLNNFKYPYKIRFFRSKYYSLFAFLVINRLDFLTYLIIILRVKVEKWFLK